MTRLKTVIVAGDHWQFRAWCHDNQRDPRDPDLIEISSLHHIDRVRGCYIADYVTTGRWGHLANLLPTIQSRLARGQDPQPDGPS